jgi:hypothetical protein
MSDLPAELESNKKMEMIKAALLANFDQSDSESESD